MTDIFVFGSNLGGRHGRGSALEAMRKWGAIYGQGVGRQGNAYAIPTKTSRLKPLEPAAIAPHVANFIVYAREHPRDTFHVVKIGCGLAGYKEEEIAPMFKGAPDNVRLPEGWRESWAD